MIRSILSAIVLLALASPSMAAEYGEGQKPALVKGSKSYQIRYPKPTTTPEAVEPAAGVEDIKGVTEGKPAIAPSDESPIEKKVMKLHGKK